MKAPIITVSAGEYQEIVVGSTTFYYSYRVCVGFVAAKTGYIVCHDLHGPDTARHLDFIDGGGPSARKTRVESSEFELALGAL